MDKNFEVLVEGCLYLDRNGREVRITELEVAPSHPAKGSNGYAYTLTGQFLSSPSCTAVDLVQLVEENPQYATLESEKE